MLMVLLLYNVCLVIMFGLPVFTFCFCCDCLFVVWCFDLLAWFWQYIWLGCLLWYLFAFDCLLVCFEVLLRYCLLYGCVLVIVCYVCWLVVFVLVLLFVYLWVLLVVI